MARGVAMATVLLVGCAKVFGLDTLEPLSDGSVGQPCDPTSAHPTPCDKGAICVDGVCQNGGGNPDDGGVPEGGAAADAADDPRILASGQSSPTGVAIQDGTLLWTNLGDGRVMRCAAPDCAQAQPVATGESGPSAIVSVGANAFWISNDGVRGAVTGGGPVVPIVSATGLPPYLATDGTSLFFENAGNVYACPALLQACTAVAVFPSAQTSPGGMTVGNGRAYLAVSGSVIGCGVSGCASPTTIIPDVVAPTVVGVGAVAAFVADRSGQILSCPAAGGCGSSEVIVGSQSNIGAILVDGPNLYWLESMPAGSVKRCVPQTCLQSSDTLASNLQGPSAMVADATHLYFTVTQAGTVMRVSK